MKSKMADPEESYVEHPTEADSSLLYLRSDELMSVSSSGCEVMTSKPVTAYSCTFESSGKENLMPLDLFSIYNSASHPSESLEESGLFNMLGDSMVVCSSEQLESYSSSEEEILSNKDLTLDKDEIARDLLRNERQDHETSLNDLIDTFDVKTSSATLPPCSTSLSSSTPPDDDLPLSSSIGDESLSSLAEDELPSSSSTFDELISKESEENGETTDDVEDDYDGVCVGAEHQAVIPDLLPPSSRCSVVDSGEKLLWDPCCLPEQEVEAYCCQVLKQNQLNLLDDGTNSQAWSENNYIRDDEQALYLLLQCGYNVDEAVRRRQCESIPPLDVMKLWTHEECENFEIGLRLYKKNFFEIRRTKFRTRSVKELVHFYYHWKKINRRKAKLLVGGSSNSNVVTSDAPNYSQYEAPLQPQFHDVASSSNYSSYEAPRPVHHLQEFTHSPVAQSPLYPELKHQAYRGSPSTDSAPPLHWPQFRIGQDVHQSVVDYALTSRPNFDAVSIMSGAVHGLPVYSTGNCYANQVQNQSSFSGQLYADGFPELCFHKPVFLSSQSGDANYQMLTSDVYLDAPVTGLLPFKRFKSSVEYQRYDNYPAGVPLQQNPLNEELADQGYSAPVDLLPVRSAAGEMEVIDSRGDVFFPSTNCALYVPWLESPTLHS